MKKSVGGGGVGENGKKSAGNKKRRGEGMTHVRRGCWLLLCFVASLCTSQPVEKVTKQWASSKIK